MHFSAVMNHWVSQAQAQRRLQEVAQRVVRRIQNGQLSAVINQWSTQMEDRQRRWAKAQRLLATSMHNTLLSGARDTWVTHSQAHKQRRQRAKAIYARERRQHMQLLEHKMLHREQTISVHLALSVALIGWGALLRERRRMQAVAQRVLGRMRNSLLSAALQEWVAKAEERRRLQSVAQRVRGWMWNFLLSAVLVQWATQADERRRMRSSVHRVVLRMQNGLLSASLHGWAVRAQERLRLRAVVRRVLMHMANAALSLALESWEQVVVEQRHLRALAVKVLGRLQVLHPPPKHRDLRALSEHATFSAEEKLSG
jgi:hypothetical protein